MQILCPEENPRNSLTVSASESQIFEKIHKKGCDPYQIDILQYFPYQSRKELQEDEDELNDISTF